MAPKRSTQNSKKNPISRYQCNTNYCRCKPSWTVRWTDNTDAELISFLEKKLQNQTTPINKADVMKLKLDFAGEYSFEFQAVNHHYGVSLGKYLNSPSYDLSGRIRMLYLTNVKPTVFLRELIACQGQLLHRNGKIIAFASYHEDVVRSYPPNAMEIIRGEEGSKPMKKDQERPRLIVKIPLTPGMKTMESPCSLPSIVPKQEEPETLRTPSVPPRPVTNDYMFLFSFHQFLIDLTQSNEGFLELEEMIGEIIVIREDILKRKTLTYDAIQCYLSLSFIALKEQCVFQIENEEDVIVIDDNDCINLKTYLTKFKKFVNCCPFYFSKFEDLINDIDMLIVNGIRKNGRTFSSDILELNVFKVKGTFKIFIDTFELY